MKLGIRTKLFIAFLLATGIVVVSMLMFTRWSIEQGFVEYVEHRQAARIERLSDALLDIYEHDGGWEALRTDKRLWLEVLFGRGSARRAEHRDDDSHEEMEHRPPPRRWFNRLMRDDSPHWPSDRILRRLQNTDRVLPFETRMMLFDVDGQPIYGREDQLANSQRYPLKLDGQTAGFLALIRGPSLSELGQIRFLEEQQTGLILIALAVIAFSALIAVLMAQRLVRPLHGFRQAAREMASGNYGSRVAENRRDELGALAKDINVLAESLQAHESARRQWVADIAHELRTPLTVLRGELEALQDGVRELDDKAVISLHSDILRLSRLVDDLYELSMTDLGALSYRKERCHVIDVLREDIDSLAPRFEDGGIELDIRLESVSDVVMQADPQRLSQLFRNLLENTLRYTDSNGHLQITAVLEKNQLMIDFLDSAPGVPDSELSRLFERLYRVEDSRNRELGGAGLGLAIASNIVSAHDGQMTANTSPLGGLWIRIVLPVENGA